MRFKIEKANLPTILRSTADYFEKEQYPYVHPSEKAKHRRLKKTSYNNLKKAYTGKKEFPKYPASGKLTVGLKQLFESYKITPEYYK